ncbi:hypothetical protein EK21DRAFT_118455 [Setomelanomma holmii]|uniref:Uncharacterized protein n=1 Tax=Setomelanomma holmii TaxID=210430 RepID=A0A9P4GYC8_9PLEO|nr:hypothetical protein EK21DRAFT_118455 [Setomelanomma holmii]
MAGNCAQEDFIPAVRRLDGSWATHQLTELVRKDQDEAPFTAIAELVAEYRSYYRRLRPTASSLGTFATLGVAPQEKRDKKERASQGPTCLCGKKHRFNDCPYVNAKLQDAGWKPDQQTVQKFDRLRMSQSYLAKVLERVEKGLQQSTGNPVIHDDRKPPAGTSHLNPVLQTAAAVSPTGDQEVQPPLINRWILDPGLNAHVTNSKAFGWTKTAQARPGDCMYAGGQLLQIEEWGEVQLQVDVPSGTRTFKLTYVAYIPSFFTSVVGLSRFYSLGIHFESGRSFLYQQTLSQVICHLEYM